MKYINKIILFFLNLVNIPESGKKADALTQFVAFGIVGISNTAISYCAYYICIKLGVYYILASILGFFVSVTNSFFWNNRYVFKKSDNENRSILKSYIKTVLSYSLTGLVLSNILLYIGVDILHFSKLVVPLASLLITVPLNFLLNKFWTFNKKEF